MVRRCWVSFQCRGWLWVVGWCDGAGQTSSAGASYNLDYSRARAYCACSRCGWGCLDIFTLIYPFFPLSPSLWETARYRLKYCIKGPFNPKPTNQPTGPCPTNSQIRRTPRHCIFYPAPKHHPTTPIQCRGVLPIWITVGQGLIVLAIGAGGGCLDIFSLVYHFSCLSPSLWETARYRLKLCLKRPFSPKTTNQLTAL